MEKKEEEEQITPSSWGLIIILIDLPCCFVSFPPTPIKQGRQLSSGEDGPFVYVFFSIKSHLWGMIKSSFAYIGVQAIN